jgi:hypothetical protein
MSKEHENLFKFGLYQGDDPILERLFSADVYNPVIRYSVDIRDMLNDFMKRFDNIFNRRKLNFKVNDYSSIGFYKDISSFSYYKKGTDNKLSLPEIDSITLDSGKVIRGIPCKIGLYINNKTIVERQFFVYNYNPEARFSFDLKNEFEVIVGEITDYLRTKDINHMWEDYNLINKFGLNIQQIRKMNLDTRKKYVKRLTMKNKPVIRS